MGQMGFEDFFKLSIKVALDELSKASEYFSKNASVFSGDNDTMTITALNNCGELMSLALDHLNSSLSSSSGSSVLDAVNDLRTWLSSAGTYQQTCIDGFQEIANGEKYKSGISENLKTSTELTSNSLAIITWISKVENSVKLRKLLSTTKDDQEPEWLRPEVRKLMTDQGLDLKKKADFVVAKDGSSKYKTIMAALNDVPEKSKKRLIIYVKSGVYFENDTLYIHSNRQFYRECNIYGTVDFIFGNSAVVLQNCNISPKRPIPGQQNTITAQERMDPNQNTGISIQNCSIWPYGNLSGVETYLGRPWKNYSTTIFMQSSMESFINPSGWLPWIGTSGPDTIFYTEFQNYGPGSSTKNRVEWTGVKNITQKEANKFTVKPFLQGDKWIPNSVTYKSGL
ncbi:hypothetical protein QYF36_016843 [Acer negundo]|nr:hypothetical protein QYF36_016843 [Acer negundo]